MEQVTISRIENQKINKFHGVICEFRKSVPNSSLQKICIYPKCKPQVIRIIG